MRILRVVLVVLVFSFGLTASTYGPDRMMVRYGRMTAQSWVLWKIRRTNLVKLRSHEGGRVAWIIGSSVLRDAFDEKAINAALAEQGSPWRVAKYGMVRGAPFPSVGLLSKLPVQPGDRVITSVSPDNFRKDWLEYSELPDDRLLMLFSPGDLWAIEALPVQKRLELLTAVPPDVHRYHSEYMRGVAKWARALVRFKTPRRARPAHHTTFRKTEYEPQIARTRGNPRASYHYIDSEEADYSDAQLNIQGIQTLRERTAAAGAELMLFDLPHRREYYDLFLPSEVRLAWDGWRAEQPDVYGMPQVPDDDFYDFKHTNVRGRETLSDYLVTWMAETPKGELVWLRSEGQ
ncbi:MAG: hypothetical protein ACI8RZ_007524 [Myxococcota bacterium]